MAAGFLDVADVKDGLGGEELQALGGFRLVRGDGGAGGVAGLQGGDDGFDQGRLLRGFAVAAAGFLLQGGEAAFADGVAQDGHQIGVIGRVVGRQQHAGEDFA